VHVFCYVRLSVIIDPFHDHRSRYRFPSYPICLRQSGLYENVSDDQSTWQGIWYASASLHAEDWVAEIAIPFKSLAFDPRNDTWGINFRRALARRDERMGWVSRNRDTNPGSSGDAIGFEGLDQGVGLDIVPSATYSQHKQFATPGTPVTTSVSGSDADVIRVCCLCFPLNFSRPLRYRYREIDLWKPIDQALDGEGEVRRLVAAEHDLLDWLARPGVRKRRGDE
jgi:hypothetical protein